VAFSQTKAVKHETTGSTAYHGTGNVFFWGWVLILPTMVGLIILNIYPMIKTVYQSFCKTGDFGRGGTSFIGTANYAKLFSDPEVWQATLNTFKYMVVEVPFSVIIALVLRRFA
jgi:multiple sugar transport system permease protein